MQPLLFVFSSVGDMDTHFSDDYNAVLGRIARRLLILL